MANAIQRSQSILTLLEAVTRPERIEPMYLFRFTVLHSPLSC